MANKYKRYGKTDIKNLAGGYKPSLLFAPVDTFLTLSLPVDNGVLGDDFKITSDHTFGGSDGFIEFLGKIGSATSKSTSDADGIDTHTVEIEIEGDSPELRSQLKSLKNPYERTVFLIKDQDCINATAYNQYGDSCLTPTVKVDFDAKTTESGTKVHKITLTIREHMYFYSGTVTQKPDVTPLACPIVTLSSTTTTVIANWGAVAGATNYDVKLFSDAAGLNQVGATQNVSTTGPVTFTGLTTATQYYVRVIPKNTQTSTTSCGLVGEKTA